MERPVKGKVEKQLNKQRPRKNRKGSMKLLRQHGKRKA